MYDSRPSLQICKNEILKSQYFDERLLLKQSNTFETPRKRRLTAQDRQDIFFIEPQGSLNNQNSLFTRHNTGNLIRNSLKIN